MTSCAAKYNNFDLRFTIEGEQVQLHGVTPSESELKVRDTKRQKSPDVFWNSDKNQAPVLGGKKSLSGNDSLYIAIRRANNHKDISLSYDQLSNVLSTPCSTGTRLPGRF